MRWARSILTRLMWLNGLALCAVAVLMPLALYELLGSAADDLHHRALSQTADEIAHYLSPKADGKLAFNLPDETRELYSHSYGRYAFAILDDSGNVLFSSEAGNAAISPGDKLQPTPAFFQLPWDNRILYGGSFPQVIRSQRVWIQIAEDLNHRDVVIDDIVADFFQRVGWITLPILLTLLAVNAIIFRYALRPVLKASRLAQAIGPAQLDYRLPTSQMPREIVPLITAINNALNRLEQGFNTQREFIAEVAHELRTPLSVLQTRLDSLGNGELAAQLRQDVGRIGRIVDQLLVIAELEAFTVNWNEAADLQGICLEVVASLAPLAIAKGKSIALTGETGPVRIRGNSDALFQAISNLASNGIRHTREGTAVEIDVDRRAIVRVIDHGPGIAKREREHIFRRFWRRDRRDAGSTGLGLAIVARIVEAHGASISIDDVAGGGAVFTIRFPPSDNVTASGGKERARAKRSLAAEIQ